MKRLLFLVSGIFITTLLTFPSIAQGEDFVDSDGDGLTDVEEQGVYHTDPVNTDTDGDGYSDGEEIAHGYSPLHGNSLKLVRADTDSDGLNDDLEIKLKTDLTNQDTDLDGREDGEEVYSGFNPLKGDGDDSLPRRVEVDISRQLTYYFLNNVKIASIPVSTGVRGMDTPKGEYEIIRKLPTHLYAGRGYYLPNVKWNMEFKRGYYLHGAYWHNQFGVRPMSHGCVNIGYANAEKLYKFTRVGDKVVVYGKTPVRIVSLP